MTFTLANPLAWAHFRLRGGFKNLATTMIAYAVIIGGLILLSIRADPLSAATTLYYWTNGLMGLQLGILLIFAPTAIRNSIRKDVTTHMIESHRLMPVPATQAITGILVGSTAQFIVMALGTFFVGILTCLGAGVAVQNWILANVIVGIFGLCFWLVAAMFAFLSPAGMPIMAISIVGSLMSNGMVLMILPGLGLLVSPMMGHTVFGIIERGGGGEWSWGYQIAALAQLSTAGLFFLAAVRKYKREDQLAFTPAMGLILLLGWVLICVTAIRNWDVFNTQLWWRDSFDSSTRSIGAVLSAMILALVPISSAAWLHEQWQKRRRLPDAFLDCRPVPANVIVLVAVAIVTCVALGVPEVHNRKLPVTSLIAIALTAGSFLFAGSYLLRILYRVTTRVLLWMMILMLLTWALPLLIDFGAYAAARDPHADVLTFLGACSPIGLIYNIWNPPKVWQWPCLAIQAIPGAILAILYHTTQRRKSVAIANSALSVP